MEFLAKEVARLHRLTKKSFLGKGSHQSISNKLAFNKSFFQKTMEHLSSLGCDISNYSEIFDTMEKALISLKTAFQARFDQGHIRECHGDLKLENLWIQPASYKELQQKLFALDCIDFNPDFYHIDTLSDAAMLVMDLQIHLQPEDRNLVEVFITTYLQEMAEDGRFARSILMYYTAEKAIVCANVSILLDNNPDRGLKCLVLAKELVKELKYLLEALNAQQMINEKVVDLSEMPSVS